MASVTRNTAPVPQPAQDAAATLVRKAFAYGFDAGLHTAQNADDDADLSAIVEVALAEIFKNEAGQ